jgi:hypothetical protein
LFSTSIPSLKLVAQPKLAVKEKGKKILSHHHTWMSNIASGLTEYPVLSLMNAATFTLLFLFASLHCFCRSSLSANY